MIVILILLSNVALYNCFGATPIETLYNKAIADNIHIMKDNSLSTCYKKYTICENIIFLKANFFEKCFYKVFDNNVNIYKNKCKLSYINNVCVNYLECYIPIVNIENIYDRYQRDKNSRNAMRVASSDIYYFELKDLIEKYKNIEKIYGCNNVDKTSLINIKNKLFYS